MKELIKIIGKAKQQVIMKTCDYCKERILKIKNL